MVIAIALKYKYRTTHQSQMKMWV